jgi:hypothetical protein
MRSRYPADLEARATRRERRAVPRIVVGEAVEVEPHTELAVAEADPALHAASAARQTTPHHDRTAIHDHRNTRRAANADEDDGS